MIETFKMSEEEKSKIEAEWHRSELRWRSDIENDIKELVRLETARVLKYDAFLDKMIAREDRRARFQDAVIEKGVIALLGTGIGAVLMLIWAGAKVQFAELFKK